MKQLTICLTLLIGLFLLGCQPGTETENSSINLPGAGSERPPAKWSTLSFPLPLEISEDFSNDEITAIIDRANAWEISVDNKLDFFDTTLPTVPNYEPGSSSSFQDGQLGIYKSYNWFSDFGSGTLAVTQFYGYYDQDSAGLFIDIVHADIIFNYRDWDFSLNPGILEHDFESVMVHELGHFIGLKHDSRAASVMRPSLYFQVERREPGIIDEESLLSNYRLPTADPLISTLQKNAMVVSNALSNQNVNHELIGKKVRGIIELKSDGLCVHKINGKIIKTHQKEN